MFTHQFFERQARDTPDSIAVVDEERTLSYRELERRSNQLARYLRSRGVAPEVPVGVFMERSLELVVAILGLMKAGGVYVPFDPSNPKERLWFIDRETKPRMILSQEPVWRRLELGATAPVIFLDKDWNSISKESAETIENLTVDGNLGFLIYTSGSTGEPKAVMLPHRSRDARISHEHKMFGLNSEDRHVLKSSISFTLLLREMFWPLLTGARVIISRPGTESDLDYLLELIRQHRITIITLTPSTLRAILAQPLLDRCSSLRHVTCFGEPLTADLQSLYFSKLSATLTVYYGATEAPSATHRICCPNDGPDLIDLGQPLPGVEVHLLDESKECGTSGEIYLGGRLAHGYFGRPALTAEKFVPHPFSKEPGARLYRTGDFGRLLPDGHIEFVGRVDDLVKIRGFRVELGEIARTIRQHPDIRDAFVAALDSCSGQARLIAYAVPNMGSNLDAMDVRSYVAARLPHYMVPARVVFLEALPVSANGKIDRRALPAPGRSRPNLETPFVSARTPLENDLAQIWCEVLELDEIGIHDNFLDLGGHSLTATRIVTQVIGRYRIQIPLRSLFQSPTIAEMAAIIEQQEKSEIGSTDLAQLLDQLDSCGEEEASLLVQSILHQEKE